MIADYTIANINEKKTGINEETTIDQWVPESVFKM